MGGGGGGGGLEEVEGEGSPLSSPEPCLPLKLLISTSDVRLQCDEFGLVQSHDSTAPIQSSDAIPENYPFKNHAQLIWQVTQASSIEGRVDGGI